MSTLAINVPVPASGDGPFVDVSSLAGPKTVLLSGLFRGAYTLLASQDDANFVPILQFDAGGVEGIEQTVPGSVKSMRLRANAVPSGAIVCSVSGITGAGAGVNNFATVATLAAGFSGTTASIDTFALFPPSGIEATICFLCRGLFQGQIVVEGSNDDVNWNPVGSFQSPFVPTDLLGLPNVLEFAPLDTDDKTRYLRLNVDGSITSAVVTVGGSVPGTGYALTDLSNLTPTAINMSLVPSAGGTIDLGSASAPFKDLYLAGTVTGITTLTGTKNTTLVISVPSQGTADANGAGIQILADSGGSGGAGNHDGGNITLAPGLKSGSGNDGKVLIPATIQSSSLSGSGSRIVFAGANGNFSATLGAPYTHFSHVSGTTYDVSAIDNGQVILCENAADTTVTFPSGLGASFSTTIVNLTTAGAVTIAAGGGTSVSSPSSAFRLVLKNQAAEVFAIAADTYQATGPLVA